MSENRRRGPGGHGPIGAGEKPKDMKKTVGKLVRYMKPFHAMIIFVIVCALLSAGFSIAGPKILGNATQLIYEGFVAKIQGSGGIDFDGIAKVLLTVLAIYVISAILAFIQGLMMTDVSQKICYKLRKEMSEKIHRLPMNYYDTKTHGEVLSRITNDVDTLGQSLNQSITQLITSITTLLGVLVMMLTISPLLTLVSVVILPISVAMIGFIIKKSQKYFLK